MDDKKQSDFTAARTSPPGAGVHRKLRLEEDDIVASVRRKGDVKLGLVSQVFEHDQDSASDSDSDSDSDSGGTDYKLSEGQIRVEWYPTGREVKMKQDKLILLDRGLMIGETVSRGEQIGLVLDFHSVGDFLLLPSAQTVLKGVDISRMAFVNPFDTSSTSCHVLYKNWAGTLTEVEERMLLRSPKGHRCWLLTQSAEDVRDTLVKKEPGSNFDCNQWYPGQNVSVPFETLKNVDWVEGCRPPEKIMRRIGASHRRAMAFTIEKVELVSLTVRWIMPVTCAVDTSLEDFLTPPNPVISATECSQVRKMDMWEYQSAQIGDRMIGRMEAGQAVLPVTDWKKRLRQMVWNFQERGREELGTGDAESMDCEQYFTASENSSTIGEKPASESADVSAASSMESVADVGAPASTQRPTAEKRGGRFGFHKLSGRWFRLPSSNRKKTKKRVRWNREAPVPSVGESFVAELVFQRSFMDVLWQDGSVEHRVPSYEIEYFDSDLDQHLFLPGDFVKSQESEELWQMDVYGLVEKVENEERLATVSWFRIREGVPERMEREKVSVLELLGHPGLDFPPNMPVMKVGDARGPSSLTNIGQVYRADLETGKVIVCWLDGTKDSVWPTDLVKMFATEDQNDLGDIDSEDMWTDVDESSDSSSTGSESCASSDSAFATIQMLKERMAALRSILIRNRFLTKPTVNEESVKIRADIVNLVVKGNSLFKKSLMLAGHESEFKAEAKERKLYSRFLRVWLESLPRNLAERSIDPWKLKKIDEEQKKEGAEESQEEFFRDALKAVSGSEAVEQNPAEVLAGLLKNLQHKKAPQPRSEVALAAVDLCCIAFIDCLIKAAQKVIDSEPATGAMETDSVPNSPTGLGPEEEMEVEKAMEESGALEILEQVSEDHSFLAERFAPDAASKRFLSAVRQELKLLRSSLPPGVVVLAFENRMDLYSVMMVGPKETPYHDGLFFLDIRLPQTYPLQPPFVHYKAYSSEQLNPNLYQEGKVCVSLLGTWSGKASEVWNPGSNLLQVLVSIQGLILNKEPYFNEAGYDGRRTLPESAQKSRRYNEMALIRSVEQLTRIAQRPPTGFREQVRQHLLLRGPCLVSEVNDWLDEKRPCGFPLLPVSGGFKLTVRRQLSKLQSAIDHLSRS